MSSDEIISVDRTDWHDGPVFTFHYADGHIRKIYVRTQDDIHEVHHLMEHVKIMMSR